MAQKNTFTKQLVLKQDFSYTKNNTSLSFTLRVDNSSEIKDFKSLLQEAVKDIDEILKGMKN